MEHGLTQCEADKEYVLLAAPSFQLVILQIPQRIAASITIDKPPRKEHAYQAFDRHVMQLTPHISGTKLLCGADR